MHIEEIIIDGFKSYSTRVPVGPFDRQFNAITGGVGMACWHGKNPPRTNDFCMPGILVNSTCSLWIEALLIGREQSLLTDHHALTTGNWNWVTSAAQPDFSALKKEISDRMYGAGCLVVFAIGGLNGSGKSNILDAICFVLGISNLTQVRVGNLSELVYKQGQAGVTKASVTIVFNNEDKQNSPVGYLDLWVI